MSEKIYYCKYKNSSNNTFREKNVELYKYNRLSINKKCKNFQVRYMKHK